MRPPDDRLPYLGSTHARLAETKLLRTDFWLERWLVLFAALVLAHPAMAQEMSCAGRKISINAASNMDREEVCRAVSASHTFLASVGLRLPGKVMIHVDDRLKGQHGGDREIARYDGRDCSIHILAYAVARSMARQDSMGGLGVMGLDLWRSYVVHELTHAAIHASCERVCPDRATHEYIAAVAQMSSLPASLREAILRRNGKLAGFAGQEEISDIYYALSPSKFMVKSYRHYLEPGNGSSFIRALLKPASVARVPASE